MTAIKEAVTDAVATMKKAEQVIDGLMAVNARLRRENFAMLEALESCLSGLQTECDGCPGCASDPCTQCQAKAAIRLAKGVAL